MPVSEATWPRDPALRPALRSDVVEGRLLGVLVAGAEIVVARVGGTLYAADGVCTHLGAGLKNAQLQGDAIVCHFHGSCFGVRTGAVINGPASRPLRTYEVSVTGERLVIDGAPAYLHTGYTGLHDSG
jgi:nitrite reductase/ring-hydroxylating ferredoxin subunit